MQDNPRAAEGQVGVHRLYRYNSNTNKELIHGIQSRSDQVRTPEQEQDPGQGQALSHWGVYLPGLQALLSWVDTQEIKVVVGVFSSCDN